jgi:ATP-binding cassette, subfamily B, bacterial
VNSSTGAPRGLREVLGLILRCLPLCAGLWKHLWLLLAGWAAAGAAAAAAGIALTVIWWDSVLGSAPLTSWQAGLLALPVSSGIESTALRQDIAIRTSFGMALLLPVFVGLAMTLAYYRMWILQRINQELRVRLFRSLLAKSVTFHAEARVGDAVYRLFQDSAMVTQFIDVAFLTPVGMALVFGTTSAAAALFHPALGVALVIAWPATLIVGAKLSPRLRAAFLLARETNSELTTRVREAFRGANVIKAYGLEDHSFDELRRSSTTAFDAAARARMLFVLFKVLVFWVTAAIALLALFCAALLTVGHTEIAGWSLLSKTPLRETVAGAGVAAWTLGSYTAFRWLFGRGTRAVNRTYAEWGLLQDMAVGLGRVFGALEEPDAVPELAEGAFLSRRPERLAVCNVGFAFGAGEEPVLAGVSFEANAGTITAVLGPTGVGKSTLLALILRLMDPDYGAITLDHHPLGSLRLSSLREHVGAVLQDTVVFDTTVRENITYGTEGPCEEARLLRASSIACIHEVLASLPHGYDTRLGAGGVRLSAGQAQLLAIARLVYRDPALVIMDEPTSALDPKTEAAVINNLVGWFPGRIVLIAAHRPAVVANVDQVVLLSGGRGAEVGRGESLLARAMAHHGAQRGQAPPLESTS